MLDAVNVAQSLTRLQLLATYLTALLGSKIWLVNHGHVPDLVQACKVMVFLPLYLCLTSKGHAGVRYHFVAIYDAD